MIVLVGEGERMSATTDENLKLNVKVPDKEYWRKQIKCQSACPVHTDARGYVRAIAAGDYEMAYLIARGPNPLASICGRVCGALCESECRRGKYDEPLSIRALKRFVCEKFGPESRKDGGKSLLSFITEAAKKHAPSECSDTNELLPLLQSMMKGCIKKVSGKSVGIIGSGPAGLGAAHDLALMGFDVTIYELESVLGGMLAVGIPEYRLPRDLIKAEVEVITSMGVKGVTNCVVGKDIQFSELRKKHDAVIIAVGAKKARHLTIPGGGAEGVIGGIEFLRDVSLGNSPKLGRNVVVIGGGNVAYDVGRTVLRQISIDAARTAKRAAGVGEVYLCSLESLDEMPADDVEITEGDEEGIIRKHRLGPKEILTDENGRLKAVRFQRCLRVFDENRRFSPIFDDKDIVDIPCDNALIAIGQAPDLSFLDAVAEGIKLNERGMIACDLATGATSAPDVYIAGDLAYGPKLLIHAVAHGKAVARALYEKTTGHKIAAEDVQVHFPVPTYDREEGYEKIHRAHPDTVPASERVFAQDKTVEKIFSPEQAKREADRCLDCGINTIFDGERCLLCAGCVDVCPRQCLRIVSADQIKADPTVSDVVKSRLEDFPVEDCSMMLKDETSCIRCALCAERCPAGAITMERFTFEEKPICQAD